MGDLHADITALYKAGAVTIPHAANYFGKAAQNVHKTALSDEALFQPVGDGSGTSSLSQKWSELRNTMQDQVLVKTQNNLIAAGEALVEVAESYVDQDGVNGDALEESFQDIDDRDNPADAPPPYVTPAPGTGDPHPEQYGPH